MSPMLTQLLPFILIFVVFYFLLIRPQQKRQRERQSLLSAIKENDSVVTIGGLHGVVESLDEKTVTLKVDNNVRMKFERSAVNAVKKD